MKTLGIFLPTYKRPHTLQGVASNIEETTLHPFTLYFGIEPEDGASIEAAKATGHQVIINQGKPGYSDTIQTIYENSREPFFIHANDDFAFTPHWDEVPVSMFDTPTVMVVGLRQSEGDISGSAICMIRRKYIEEQSGVVDMPNRVFYPYHHNFQDTEFTETAQRRGVWAKCDKLVIIHRHPVLMGSSERDETYKKNEETSILDREIFESRRHLW
jgi:hypothetical protein